MKKFFKYLSYSLVYLLISIASAYGVITLSVNFSNRGQDSSLAGATVAEEITNVVSALSSSTAINADLGVVITTDNQTIEIVPDINLDMSNGIASLEADGTISVVIAEKTSQSEEMAVCALGEESSNQTAEATQIDIDITFKNQKLYVEMMNNKFVIETSNIMSTMGQIFDLIGVDLSLGGFDLGSLDFNSVLAMLTVSNQNYDQKDVITFDIAVPVVGGTISVVCDKDWKILSLDLSGLEMEGISIAMSGNLNYPEQIVVEEKNDSEFVNVTTLLDSATTLISYFKENTLAFDLDLNINGYDFSAKVDGNIANKAFKVSTTIGDFDANFILKDSVIYAECENVYGKFALSDCEKLTPIFDKLCDKLGSVLPVSEVMGMLDQIMQGDLSSITSSLGMDDFDLQTLDLSILESIVKNENTITITLKDIGSITIEQNDGALQGLYADVLGVKASLTMREYSDFTLSTAEENYVDIASFIPTISNMIDFASNTSFAGTVSMSDGENVLPINFKIDFENELYGEISTELYGQDVKIVYTDSTFYVDALGNKICASIDDFDKILDILESEFDLTFNQVDIDTNEILDTLKEVLSVEVYPLFVKSFVSCDEQISLTLFNDIVLTFGSSSTSVSMGANYKDYSLTASVLAENVEKTEIDESEYTKAVDLLTIAKNVYNQIQKGAFYLEFSGSYDNFSASGAINLDNSGLDFVVNAKYGDISACVTLLDGIIYISAENIDVSFDLNDFDEALNFISSLGFDIDKIFDGLKSSYGVDVDLIVSYLLGKSSLDALIDSFDLSSNTDNLNTESFDIQDFIDNSSIVINKDVISIEYNNLSASINFADYSLSSANIDYNGLSANVIFSSSPFDFSPTGEFLDVMSLVNYADKAMDYVREKRADINLCVVESETNSTISGRLQLDLTSALKLGVQISSTTVDNMDISLYVEDGMLYADYNGLKIKINNEHFKELLYMICELMGIDASKIPFIDDVNLNLDYSQIQASAKTVTTNDMIALAVYIKDFYEENNSLIVVLDGEKIYNNENAEDLTLSIMIENDKLSKIVVNNVYLSSSLDKKYDITLTTNEWTEFNGVNKDENYVDISGSNELLKAFINMSSKKDFHISGSIDIDGELAGVDISKNVPFDIQVKVDENNQVELYAVLGEIPAIVGVNNDVPYEFGDTESGSDRMLYVYYKDGYVYFYRSEYVDIMFGASKRQYEKCVKVALETVLDDPMTYLQYCIGFSDTIMEAISEAMEKSSNRTEPMDYSNIIKSFTVTDSSNYTLALNLAEIANNSDLDSLTLSLHTSKDANDEEYLSDLGFSVYMPLASIFKLTLSSDDTTLVDWGSEVDMTSLREFVSSYTYGEGEYWQASNGEWEKASETTYTISFVENGGDDVDDITAKPGTTITLPAYDTVIEDDKTTQKTTKVFIGWFTSENFKDGTLYTSTTMPSHDLYLYAKWTENVEYYRTITFETDCDESIPSITALIGSEITIPSPLSGEQKVETIGTTTSYYDFGGWYTDEDFHVEFTSSVMPSENTTLYARWKLSHSETTAKLNVYDNGVSILSTQVKVGSSFEELVSNLAKVNSNTKFYTDSSFSSLYSGDFVMNDGGIDLYIRNLYTLTFTSEYGNTTTSTITMYQGEKIIMPSQESYTYDDGSVNIVYTFDGWSETYSTMPNESKTITANWTVVSKNYYTVQFDLSWYIVFGTTAGCAWKSAPSAMASETWLEGETIDLTQASYQPTGVAYTTAVHTYTLFGKTLEGTTETFKATSWGTSAWSDYTQAGNGFASYTVSASDATDGVITLYACWEKQ